MESMWSLLSDYYGHLLLLGSIYSIIILYSFWDNRTQYAIKWFLIATVSIGIWFTMEGLIFITSSSTLTYLGLYLMRIIGAISSLSIIFFVIEYTEGVNIKYKHIFVLSFPLLIVHIYAIISGNTIFSSVNMFDTYVEWEYNSLGEIHYLYIVCLHIFAIGKLSMKSLFKTDLKRNHSLILLLGYLVAVIPSLLTDIGIPPYLNLGLFGIGLSLLIYAYGMKKYGLFTINPIRDAEFVRKIDEGIVSVNSRGLISEYNEQINDILDCYIKSGDSFSKVLNKYPEINDIKEGNNNNNTSLIDTDQGQFEVTRYDLSNQISVFVFRDNTRLYEEKEKLDLIRKIHARIFRHNFRNTINIITSHSKLIQERSENKSVKNSADTINNAAEEIVSLNDKTSTINDVIENLYDTEIYNIQNVIDTQENKLSEQFEDSYEINKNIESLDVEAHTMLPIAVFNVLENCIKHNENPHITIQIQKVEGNRVKIIFADDGTGMAEREYKPINDGDIDPLNHASRSGLWLIKWIVEYASPDGEFIIKSSDNSTECIFELNISE
jgi:two-component sensor histidine kinase